MKQVIIAYHKFCRDGFASAAIATLYFLKNSKEETTITFFPLYPDEVNDGVSKLIETKSKDTELYFLDLAFKSFETLQKLLNHFDRVVMLDHHETSIRSFDNTISGKYGNSVFYINDDECGASMTWKHFFEEDIPKFIGYVKDRDRFEETMPDSNAVTTGLYSCLPISHNKNEEVNEKIKKVNPLVTLIGDENLPDFFEWFEYMENDDWLPKIKQIGNVITTLKNREIRTISGNAALKQWEDYTVYFCNSASYISDVGAYLYNLKENNEYKADFSFIWRYDQENKMCWISLRSRKESDIDLSKIAAKYGGGGHKSASGFKCTLDELISFIN